MGNVNLEKEKGGLEGTIKSIKSSVKSESGADSCSVTSDSIPGSLSLPPLPGLNTSAHAHNLGPMLPGMMLPGMMSMRPAPLGEISPSPRSDRRSSPDRRHRGYSPARSDRGGGGYRRDPRYSRDSDHDGDYYRDRDSQRYRHRDDSPRSDRSSRYSDRDDYSYREHRAPSHSGPSTSSPNNYRV